MPVLNGQHVSVEVWRAAISPTAEETEEATVEATVPEPKRTRAPRAKKDAAAQVMAAFGIEDQTVTSSPAAPADSPDTADGDATTSDSGETVEPTAAPDANADDAATDVDAQS